MLLNALKVCAVVVLDTIAAALLVLMLQFIGLVGKEGSLPVWLLVVFLIALWAATGAYALYIAD